MATESTDQRSLLESLDALRRDVAQLADRLKVVESTIAAPIVPKSANNSPAPAASIDEELLGVISAAIAAYLGVLPRIRQMTLIGGAYWAQQGRVTVQASHTFDIRHD